MDHLNDPETAMLVAELAYAQLQTWRPLLEAFAKWLCRPEVQAEFRRWQKLLEEMNARVEAVDAPGYTPYFERLGHSGFLARLHAGLVRHVAKKQYEQAGDHRIALLVFHDLAKRRRWHPALSRQIERFRDHCWNAGFLDDAFRDAGCPELKQEMLDLLCGTRGGDFSCGPRILAIAARVRPYAPSPRGRHQRFETVLHQTLLRWKAEDDARQAYTYGAVRGSTDRNCKDDFTDEATAATRAELRRPTFNPIAARRAERKKARPYCPGKRNRSWSPELT